MTKNIEFTHQQKRAFQPQKLSAPRDFTVPSVIKNSNSNMPLVLEIGAGKGKHALSFAAEHPDKHLIAIERTRNKFEAFTKQFEQQLLDNLTPIHADAIAWTVHALPPNCLTSIYLLYPNPEQHNLNQQWLNMPFFEFLLSRLQTGGTVILATNIDTYMDNAVEQASTVWALPNNRYKIAIESQRTHFEVKYLARRETCWELVMTKPQGYKTRFDDWCANNV